ncbi:MAG: TVP38/TMEM64 family protein [Candidatus Gastranaerophilaceae bacterium]|jgi:uncharacterized membrane protein YdjX (TVP38/TMEM64 family)
MYGFKKISLIVLIIFILLIFFALIKGIVRLNDVQFCIKGCGNAAPLLFIFIYSIAPTFFIPITPLSITAGIFFGPIWGTIYTIIGSTLGGCVAFMVSRYLLKDWVDQKTPTRVAIFREKITKEGWKFLALSRITPIFPFNVQNYIFGLTDIKIKTFFLVSLYSLIPGSFTYVYLGYAGKSLLKGEKGMFLNVTIAVMLLLIFTFLPKILSYFNKKIRLMF